ncbi:acyl carrier protein [Cohnella cholangitidis]|uniref:Acyl carrier protein n=1 Tax=Cohnella cholangitidis TaxID=2598458 RepID=A0A7G5C428_9BACL|nr:acyl carrier protein [Cohnella cholangitidis]QMV43962.1 acyl carrier protein [Cohnella cholangitidis]
MSDAQDKILDIISRVCKKERMTLSKDTDMGDLDFDSMTFVEIVLLMEEELGLTIPDNDLALESFRTVADFEAAAVIWKQR